MHYPKANQKLMSLAVASACAALIPAYAQTTAPEDTRGGDIPTTSIQQVTVTDENGFYRVLNLPTGMYEITAELDGFATATASLILLPHFSLSQFCWPPVVVAYAAINL